jgi:hypothetical protein
MQFELARPADEPALRRLLRETPLRGAVNLTLEREPCIHFASTIEGKSTQILVARPAAAQPIVAMGTRTLIECYVNGHAAQIGYLGQLRITPRLRSHPRLLKRGYTALREFHADGAAEFYVTTIVSDNEPARRVLEAGLPDLPTYRYLGDQLTFLVSTSHKRALAPGTVEVAGARLEDLDDIVGCLERNGARYQFAPRWTRADLLSVSRSRGLRIEDFLVARRGRAVVGCLACWDQREFKQTVVRGYARRMAWARPLSNLLSPLTGVPRLPAVGIPLAFAYASHLAVDDDDADVFEALVGTTLSLARGRGLDQIVFGLSARHPLTPVACARFRSRQYRSRVYVVHWADGAAAAERVDSRPIQLEVAIL